MASAPLTFCTYFDSGYLTRGLALHASLQRHAPKSQLHVLALDQTAVDQLRRLALPGIVVIPIDELEQAFPELLEAKANRSRIEYYFTCTPKIPLYVLERNPDVARVFYVDADFFFFSSAQALLDEMGEHSVYTCEHRFPDHLRELNQYGRFNVGVLGFKNDEVGKQCLRRWGQQCVTWCYDRLEGNRFADQKYLDDWPETVASLKISEHPGVNVAPWNRGNYSLSVRGREPHVNGQPLVCYHFHGLRTHALGVVEPQQLDYGVPLSSRWIRSVYAPYLKALSQARRLIPSQLDHSLRHASSLSMEQLIHRCGSTQFLLPWGPSWAALPPRMAHWYLRLRRRLVRWRNVACESSC